MHWEVALAYPAASLWPPCHNARASDYLPEGFDDAAVLSSLLALLADVSMLTCGTGDGCRAQRPAAGTQCAQQCCQVRL